MDVGSVCVVWYPRRGWGDDAIAVVCPDVETAREWTAANCIWEWRETDNGFWAVGSWPDGGQFNIAWSTTRRELRGDELYGRLKFQVLPVQRVATQEERDYLTALGNDRGAADDH